VEHGAHHAGQLHELPHPGDRDTGLTNNPSSGLHYGTTAPTVSGRMHDNTLNTTSRCGYCHESVTIQTGHVNGMFNAGTGATGSMGLATFYTQ